MKKFTRLIIITALLSLIICAFSVHAASKTPIALSEKNTVLTLSRESYKYNGKEKRPNVTLKYLSSGGKKIALEKGRDYSVSYADNTNAGAAKVIVRGKGDYSGRLAVKFAILPKKASGLKVTGTSKDAIRISWNAVKGAKGYDVLLYIVPSKTTKHFFVSSDKTKFRFSSLPADRDFKIKVRAYITVNREKRFGSYSDTVKTATKAVVGKPSLSGYCSLISVPTIQWSKATNADSYAVLRSSSKNGTYKKIAAISGTYFSDEGAALHQTYYYKIKAVRKLDGKTYYGRESNIVKVKAKKTVIVGDSIMHGLVEYKVFPGGTCVTKIGMGTYTFYSSYYFSVNGSPATGCEKLISYNPDRVFFSFGMNETAYKGNGSIIEYYEYALEDILDARPGCEIILLSVSPTTANSGSSIPKKGRIDSFNSAQKAFAKEMGVKYYDFTAPFKDSNGYLLGKYNGGDGCHWNISGYRLFLDIMNGYVKNNP